MNKVNLLQNKRGQEEIMGFMLVVILVVIIGLAVIFLFNSGEGGQQRDFQIENLLYSVLATTYDGQDIDDRIRSCEFGEECEELGMALETVLNAAFSQSGLVVGQNLKGYSLNMSGSIELDYFEGDLIGQSVGAAIPVSDTLIRLKFYY